MNVAPTTPDHRPVVIVAIDVHSRAVIASSVGFGTEANPAAGA